LLETNKIRQLIEMMVSNDVVEMSLRDGDVEVSLRRPNHSAPGDGHAVGPVVAANPAAAAPVAQEAAGASEADVTLAEIPSPMVGTFYVSPTPEAPPFVRVGSAVGPDTVVCIIEAMKVFNEIKADVSGTIERVLVDNEQAIEFGQPLFLVRPN